MPIYEYECSGCGTRFDRRQSVHEAPVQSCPDCGGSTRRIMHPVGIIFKGSGFYVTDNRKGSSTTAPAKSTNGSDGAGKNDSEKSSESTSSDKKSDAAAVKAGASSAED